MPRRIISLFICLSLFFTQSGFAQVVGQLDISGSLLALHNSFIQPDKFRPVHLRYLSYDPLANNFNLLLDKGDRPATGDTFHQGSNQAVNRKVSPSFWAPIFLLTGEILSDIMVTLWKSMKS